MLQTWIIRSDIHPFEALKTNEDKSICGSCPLKGDKGEKRSCYVNMATPGNVYRYHNTKGYPLLQDPQCLKNRPIRLGAYGDPAAVPYAVWEPVLLAIDPGLNTTRSRDATSGTIRTGYTHLWRTADPRFRKILMASVESEEDKDLAERYGWRTFRVKKPAELVLPGELVCPASKEAASGKSTITCSQCGLCGGSSIRGSNIVINAHGSRAKYI